MSDTEGDGSEGRKGERRSPLTGRQASRGKTVEGSRDRVSVEGVE